MNPQRGGGRREKRSEKEGERERENKCKRVRAEDLSQLDWIEQRRVSERNSAITAGRKLLPEIVSIQTTYRAAVHRAACQLAIIWSFIIFTRASVIEEFRGSEKRFKVCYPRSNRFKKYWKRGRIFFSLPSPPPAPHLRAADRAIPRIPRRTETHDSTGREGGRSRGAATKVISWRACAIIAPDADGPPFCGLRTRDTAVSKTTSLRSRAESVESLSELQGSLTETNKRLSDPFLFFLLIIMLSIFAKNSIFID